MKVIHLSTTISGGAGRAAVRSVQALNLIGIESTLLSRNEARDNLFGKSKFGKLFMSGISSAITIGQEALIQNSEELMTPFSFNILQNRDVLKEFVKDYDVVHLHAAYNFFSPAELIDWLRDTPLAITLHDQRLLTGGCHYAAHCLGIRSNCSNCPKVRKIARKTVENRKREIGLSMIHSNRRKLHLIAPSKWMQNEIQTSPESREISSSLVYNCVPNYFFVDPSIEAPHDKCPQVGIVATDILSPYKGFDFFLEGMSYFSKKYGIDVEVVVVTSDMKKKISCNEVALRVVSPKDDVDYLRILDNLSVLCVPSSMDNSPNVITEALARRIMVLASTAGGTGEIPNKIGINTFQYGDLGDFADNLAKALIQKRTTEEQDLSLRKLVSERVHALELKNIYESMI
jgi:glycosyltransferase involved in cell wall biosynthesis